MVVYTPEVESFQFRLYVTAPEAALHEIVAPVVLMLPAVTPVGVLHDGALVLKLAEAVKADDPLEQTVCTCHS